MLVIWTRVIGIKVGKIRSVISNGLTSLSALVGVHGLERGRNFRLEDIIDIFSL